MTNDKANAKAIPSGIRSRAKHTSRLIRSLASAGLKRLVRQSEADDQALGDALFREMDQMKGMAMKVGQILSYLDIPLPPRTQAALGRLQEGVQPLDYKAMEAVLEAAFGAPVKDLFDALDQTPIAAASIGQVHRGRYQGQEVAVKVQYPGIEASFTSDMTQLGRIAKLASLAAGVDGEAIVRELHSRLKEECNYRQEAASQRAFKGAWRGDPKIIIPAVIDERVHERVLTTAFMEGTSFQGFLEGASQGDRNAAALTLTRFAWKSFFIFQAIHADPHPGNYRFRDNGEVVFLDFGCIRRFDAPFVEAWRALFQSVLVDDRPGFEAATRQTGMVRTDRFDYQAHHALIAYTLAPYRSPTFRFDPGYSAQGHRFMGAKQPNNRAMDIPPPWIWLVRMQFGLHGVLSKLRAEGNFKEILADAMAGESEPL